MKNSAPQHLVSPIRKRLILILLAALLAVVGLVIAVMLASTFFFINRVSNPQPPPRSVIAPVLEAYYEGAGSWAGVEILLKAEPPVLPGMGRSEWKDTVLLDAGGVILLDHGSADTSRVGRVYTFEPGDTQAPLFTLEHRQIGTLVSSAPPSPPGFIQMLLAPLGLVSISLAFLTLMVGFLLTKRLINPLAEVIAAARSVAGGNLSTRVSVSGPDDLKVLSDNFNQMADTLEKNDREQREMLDDIAHELRTPLAIIQGRLEGIVDGIYPATRRQLAPVLDETYMLEKIIEDLDMLAQAASRKLCFQRETVRLDELLLRVIENFLSEAAGKGIAIAAEVQPDLPAVTGDPQRISQVISNLLSNALRYIPAGGVVSIPVIASEGGVTVTFNDNGPGVSEKDLPHIFDRLWRAEKSRSRAFGGAGLGLAIARQFIELQGGKIWAFNRPEGGFQVGFWLPES